MLNVAVDSVVIAAQKAKLPPEQYEIVIVDDSGDALDKVEITNTIAPVRLFSNPKAPRGGASSCRNFAVSHSSGDIVFFLDDDDFFLENRFLHCLPIFENPGVDVVLEPSIREVFIDGQKQEYISGPQTPVDNVFSWMIQGDETTHVATGATSFRRAAFDRVGGLDEALVSCEDGELLLRFCYLANVMLVNHGPVVQCTTHDLNTSRESQRRRFENMRALKVLYTNLQASEHKNAENDRTLKHFISAKLNYLLHCCYVDYSYWRSVYEGLHVLSYFQWNCLSKKNVKSILVLLFKIRGASS